MGNIRVMVGQERKQGKLMITSRLSEVLTDKTVNALTMIIPSVF
jgi:hypothetical protein